VALVAMKTKSRSKLIAEITLSMHFMCWASHIYAF